MGQFLHYGLNCINYGAFWGWGSGHFLHYPQKSPKKPHVASPLQQGNCLQPHNIIAGPRELYHCYNQTNIQTLQLHRQEVNIEN